jgi:hypothetical protein
MLNKILLAVIIALIVLATGYAVGWVFAEFGV